MTVKQYFESYPASKKCFQTSDGLIFHQEGDANLHAKSLDSDLVKTFKRGEEVEKEDGKKAPKETKGKAPTPPVKSEGEDGQEHILTEEDFVKNPELADQGLVVGDTITIPGAKEVKEEKASKPSKPSKPK